MLAGVLRNAGYYMGDKLWGPRESNPLGFFEDEEINAINEELIANVTKARPSGVVGGLYRNRPTFGQRWLARVPVGTVIRSTPDLDGRMAAEAEHESFCFKDPRFCYTLPAWRPFVGDAALLCIFREPARTARSILKECETPYLHSLSIDFDGALEVWTLMYRHVLESHRHEGEWVFVHYDQVFDGSAAPALRKALDVEPDFDFPEQSLRRSSDDGDAGAEAMEVYRELCRLASYEG
jgi:hypothetical protein